MHKMKLKDIKCYVFDMDGTIYLEEKLLNGAFDMFNYFNDKNIPYYFLTNNSSKSKKSYLNKLHNLGVDFVQENQIITSGDITIAYIKEKFDKPSVYLIGTKDLEVDFIDNGVEIQKDYGKNIDAVIVAFDTTLTYEKLEIATRYIRKGVPFISTHMDLVCPVKNGEFIPDCGAITKLIEVSTSKDAKYIGKPCEETVRYLINKISLDKSQIAIVGDRLYTDVATGVQNGMMGIAVLTGETTPEEILSSDIKPTLVFEDVNELYGEIKKTYI